MKQVLAILSLLALSLQLSAQGVWLEGEDFTSASKLKAGEGLEKVKNGGKGYGQEGWGNTKTMSGGKVLHVNIGNKDVEKFVTADGLSFSYDFNLKKSGNQNIWARIGYEWIRSDFQWRLDNGIWETSSRNTPTINIQPIQTWNELAWLKLGQLDLKSGKHKIEIKYAPYKIKGRKGTDETSRLLAMLDVIYITPDAFNPQGKWQPGKDHLSDKDKQAAKHVFKLNNKAGIDGRAWTVLNGLWQYAAWEETKFPIQETNRLKPATQLPKLDNLRWFAYNAPSGRDDQLPEQAFAHRYLLQTKIDVPEELKGKSFFLDVQRSSLVISIFVNGKLVGSTDTFHTAWQMDLSKQIEPGKINHLVIAVKDAYYSLNPIGDKSTEGLGNRRYWNLPKNFLISNQGIASKHDMPIASDVRSGILEPASIVVAGPVYTTDVFCQPSVKNKDLTLDISVMNPEQQAATITVENQIIPWNNGKGGKEEVTFPTKSISIPAGKTANFEMLQTWTKPTLWWPDNPYLYWVVTTIKKDGKIIDTKKTRFGFREMDWSTDQFKINGVKWQMWGDTNYGPTPQSFMNLTKKSNMNQVRYWRSGGWGKMTRREVMNYFDETGMLVRSSGSFDGQLANYGVGLSEKDASGKSVAKTRLWDNWRRQMTKWVEEERNHPCIYIWSVENEVAYINVNNLGQWRQCEPELTKGVKHVMKVDPTRPAMVDGGNCLRDESLPINGAHYTEFMNVDFRDFPDAAYTKDHFYDKQHPQRGAWRMVPGRPIMGGEIYFANGYSTERFATIGGDKCFIGMGETMNARGLWGKMLSEGYRWCEYGSFQFWMTNSSRDYWNSWSPIAVFCRQWNWTWGTNTEIKRTLKVFNSTSNPKPIEVTWQLDIDGKKVAGNTKTFNVACGEAEEFNVAFKTPKVSKRTSGSFILSAKRNGTEVYREEKDISLLAPMNIPKPTITAAKLAVFDPKGKVKAYLKKRGITFSDVKEYGIIPKTAEVIIVGSDAIPADRSRDSLWLKLASEGKNVVVLDQQFPLSYNAINADITPTAYTGRFGFIEDMSHPIFSGLMQDDFFTWGNDHVLYRNAYKKGGKGGRSLLQCDNNLAYTAMFESQVNDGLLILSQLALKDKLSDEAVAQTVFNNMLNYAVNFKPVRKQTYSVMASNDQRNNLLKDLNLEQKPANSPMDALKGDSIAIIDANPENLKTLAANKDKVDNFCQNGGWLMLWGLTPEGLKDFNNLTGYNQVLRKFDRERVLLSYPQDKMASGITLRDVVMDTGKKMYPWMALMEPDQKCFSWMVDDTDIAPFCKFPDGLAMGKDKAHPGGDHEPRNMVNGFTSDDNWVFTYTIIMDQGHKKKFTLELPKEEELVSLKIRPSKIYHPISKIKIYFDDDPEPVIAEIPVREQPIIEDIPVPGRKAKKITLEVAEWQERGDANIVVIDNIWLQVKRSDDYTKNVASLLNVGALMVYRKGKGGIFLNQLNILPQETNPDNAVKKSTIVKTVLKNMGAIFAGKKTEIDHEIYAYAPITIKDSAFNAYVNQKGNPPWYPGGEMSAMPVGNRKFAGVDFYLSDFSTSPVPSVFMLAGEGSKTKELNINIPIEKKADSLFFLHTGNVGPNYQDWKRKQDNAKRRKKRLPEPFKLFTYQIHYSDKSTIDVPVFYDKQISNWLNKKPMPLPYADLAWTGEQKDGQKGAVWVMKWQNPNPKKEIASVMIKGLKRNGSSALFAITAGNIIK